MGRDWIEQVNWDWASPQVLVALLAFASVLFIGVDSCFCASNGGGP
jgi:hypothetical protein